MSASNLVGEAKNGAAVRTAAVARLGRWPEETGLVVVFLLMILAIGIPYPELMGPFVGVVETICGALIILGLLTRLAAIPLIIIMIVAIVSTKIPILLGHDFWIFHLPKVSRYGFWSMMHEARDDFGMLLGSIYLLIEGGGAWSLDALLVRKTQAGIFSGG